MALLNSLIDAGRTKEKAPNFPVTMIHYTKLVPSENNNYSTDNIKELAHIIMLSGGIKENLMARKKAPGEYELISGHRRRLAVKYITEELKIEGYEMVPVHVENDGDVLSEVNLILMNCAARERSDWEKMMEISRLTDLIKAMQTGTEEEQERFRVLFGREPGIGGREMRKVVAESLGLSETKVANLHHINNKLIPELKDRLRDGEIGVSVANEAAGLEPEVQQELAGKKDISIADVKEKKTVSDSDTEKETVRDKKGPIQKAVTEEDAAESQQNQEKAAEIAAEEQETENRPSVFTRERTLNNAYGWSWNEVVKAYLAEVHMFRKEREDNGLPELVFQALGKEYSTSVKDDETAFLKEGEVQFIVKIDRLNEEYDYYYATVEKDLEPEKENESAETEEPSELKQYDRRILKEMIANALETLEVMGEYWIKNQPNTYTKYMMMLDAYNMLLRSADEEGQPEVEREQPELPVMKNNDQRKEWLRDYHSWGLWYEDKNIGAKYYKYDFDNGARLIAEEYEEFIDSYAGNYISSHLHLIGGPEPPKHPKYGLGKWNRHEKYSRYPDSETELVEFLKETQKGGRD